MIIPTVAFALKKGIEAKKIEEQIGLSLLDISTWEERVDEEVLPLLWALIDCELPRAPVPPTLEMARAAPISFFGNLAGLAKVAPDLAFVLRALAETCDLVSDRGMAELTVSGPSATLRAWHPLEVIDAGRSHELFSAMICRLITHVFGDDVRPAEVRFGFENHAPIEEFERFFGSRVQFDPSAGGGATMIFEASLLQRPNPRSNEVAARFMEGFIAELRAQRMRDGYPRALWRLRGAISAMLQDGEALRAPGIAQRAGMSLRSTQRLTEQYGLTLRQMVNEARLERAKALLSANPSTSIDDLSRKLGFNDPSGFRRAFKQWSGQSIGAFRSRLR
ncbi:MAG: helix-turn-helix domain-containing protein [Pseudomonadota bacterium]